MKRLEIDFLECTPTSVRVEYNGYKVSTKRHSTVISKNNKCLALLRIGTEDTPIEDYLHTINTFFTNNK